MNPNVISQFIEPYNFITISPNTSLQDILVILKNKVNTFTPIIVKENNQLLGYLPLYILPSMILQAQASQKSFSHILVETFFIAPPPIVSEQAEIDQVLKTMQTHHCSLLLVQNPQNILVSTISIDQILTVLEIKKAL